MKEGSGIERELERHERLLARCRAVLVQCSSFRCLAYRDADGKWRNCFSDEELKGEVKEVPVI